jgi:hypothetical protein
MRLYTFTLILAGVDVLTLETGDSLEAAGIDDAVMGSSNGVVSVGFDREAESLGDAIGSAVKDVEKAGFKVFKIQVEKPAPGGVTRWEYASIKEPVMTPEQFQTLIDGASYPLTFHARGGKSDTIPDDRALLMPSTRPGTVVLCPAGRGLVFLAIAAIDSVQTERQACPQ